MVLTNDTDSDTLQAVELAGLDALADGTDDDDPEVAAPSAEEEPSSETIDSASEHDLAVQRAAARQVLAFVDRPLLILDGGSLPVIPEGASFKQLIEAREQVLRNS
jgi:hypothetical protein